MGSNPTAAKTGYWKTLVAAVPERRAFLGRTRWFLWRNSAASVASISGGWKGKKRKRGSVAECSKALDLGSSLSGGVGSNPTAASSGFNQGREALRVLEKSLKILWEHFSLAVLANNMPRTLPQPIACLLRQSCSWGPVLPLWFTDYLYCCWWFESILCWSVLPNSSQTCCDSNTATSAKLLGIRFVLRKRD